MFSSPCVLVLVLGQGRARACGPRGRARLTPPSTGHSARHAPRCVDEEEGAPVCAPPAPLARTRPRPLTAAHAPVRRGLRETRLRRGRLFSPAASQAPDVSCGNLPREPLGFSFAHEHARSSLVLGFPSAVGGSKRTARHGSPSRRVTRPSQCGPRTLALGRAQPWPSRHTPGHPRCPSAGHGGLRALERALRGWEGPTPVSPSCHRPHFPSQLSCCLPMTRQQMNPPGAAPRRDARPGPPPPPPCRRSVAWSLVQAVLRQGRSRGAERRGPLAVLSSRAVGPGPSGPSPVAGGRVLRGESFPSSVGP